MVEIVLSDDGEIDYSGYSYRELLEALDNISARRYPKNYANLQAALEKIGPAQREALARASEPASRPNVENLAEEPQPDPDFHRVKHLATAIVVAGVSAYLLWVDDLILPLTKPLKIALSGNGELLGSLAFLFAISVPASLILDYVDHRDNQKKYFLFAMFAESVATALLIFASIISASPVQ